MEALNTFHIEALYQRLYRLTKALDLWSLKLRSPENHVTASVINKFWMDLEFIFNLMNMYHEYVLYYMY